MFEDRLGAHRIAIVRALPGLGDFLCAVPAWRALRAGFPEARITLVGLSSPLIQELVRRFPNYIDHLLEFPGYPGLPEQPVHVHKLPDFLRAVHEQRLDLALQMHGSGLTSNPFTVLLGARITAGFFLPGQYCPDPDSFLPYPEHESEIWRNLRLIQFLGLPVGSDELEFPLQEQDDRACAALAHQHQLAPREYVCIHPGSSTGNRRWPAERFAAVADALAWRGLQVVLTGTHSEAGITQAVCRMMKMPAIDLAGRTDLGSLAALLHGARLLVCNDTGISHLAAALHVPSVVMFTASDPQRWAPLQRERHRVVGQGTGHEGWTIESQDVLAEADSLLRQEMVYAA